MLSEKDFADMIRLARRASLQNMDEAEAAASLLQRFASFANEQLAVDKKEEDIDDNDT